MTDPKRARCFDKDWKYVPAQNTDIRKTFSLARAEQQKAKPVNVCSLKARKAA